MLIFKVEKAYILDDLFYLIAVNSYISTMLFRQVWIYFEDMNHPNAIKKKALYLSSLLFIELTLMT